MNPKTPPIKHAALMPAQLYHLVPEKIFHTCIDANGQYDCRHNKEWGNGAAYIHSTPSKKQLKERVADMNWATYPLNENFLLLEIDPKKITAKCTHSTTNGYPYYHIWGALPTDSFSVSAVHRSSDGQFLL